MQYFIDSNIFLRALIGDNKKQLKDCVQLLTAVKENKIEANTGTIILAEVAWTLGSYYDFPKEKIITGVRSIVNLRGLKILDDYNSSVALDLYEKYSVKYIDALIASYDQIRQRKMSVISYDSDFDKLPLIREEPEGLLNNLRREE